MRDFMKPSILALTLLLTSFGCSDGGLERIDNPQLAVSVDGSRLDNFTFDLTPPGQHRDGANIIVSNSGSGLLSIVQINTNLDSTGYIAPRTTIPELPYALDENNEVNLIFRLTIPSPNDSDTPIDCPEAPANLPSTVDPDFYCGDIEIVSNAERDNVYKIYIQIRQSTGKIMVDPTVLTFENPQAGRTITKTFNITNDSSQGDLQLIKITKSEFTNNSSEQFAVDGFAWPVTIRASESLEYTLAFTPESTEEVSGKLEIQSNDPSATTTVVSIRTSSSSSAQIAVSPSSLIFPEAVVGQPQTQELTITNEGDGAALTITQMSIRPSDADAAYTILWDDRATAEEDYVEWVPGASSDIIGRAQSKVYRIRYEPTEDGTSISGTLRITSNATNVPDSAVEVVLSGNAASPIGSIAPSNIIFDVPPGMSDSRDIVVSNTGLAPLNIDAFAFASLNDGEFSLNPDPTGMSVDANGLLPITITYDRPAQGGVALGSLTLETNASDLTVNIRNNNQESALSPTATIIQSPDGAVAAGTEISLDGSTSVPNSGSINYHLWTLLERPADSTADLDSNNDSDITFTPDVAGSYRVQLVVGNSLELEGVATRNIIVE